MHIVILAAVAALLASGVVSRYRSVLELEEINYSGPTGQCYEGTIHWREPPIQGEFMTQSVCRHKCFYEGNNFFSLTDGDKCFCENDPISDKLLDMSNCMVKSCPGDPRQACGSASATIYFDIRDSRPVMMPTGPETDKYNYHYKGCYAEFPVGYFGGSNSHMTTSYCGQICLRKKNRKNKINQYFGVMNHKKCYCGDVMSESAFEIEDIKLSNGKRKSRCSFSCAGSDFEHNCGNTYYMALYKFGKA